MEKGMTVDHAYNECMAKTCFIAADPNHHHADSKGASPTYHLSGPKSWGVDVLVKEVGSYRFLMVPSCSNINGLPPGKPMQAADC